MIEKVVKRDGKVVDFDPDYLNKWGIWASNNNVDWSSVTLDAVKRLNNYCSTSEIHQAMISACIEQKDISHLDMAARLLIGDIYKEAHGGFDCIPDLETYYNTIVGSGIWVDMGYDSTELDYLNSHIDHDKNLTYSYTSLKQFKDKYMIKDKLSKVLYESPQFMFMGIAMANAEDEPDEFKLDHIVSTYELLSSLEFNLATSPYTGLRVGFGGLANCMLSAADDTAQSLGVANALAYEYTCLSAGIGQILRTRSAGDGVRNNSIVHLGKIPYYRYLQSAVASTRQGTRSGSATVYYTVHDPEFEDIVRLKSVKTPEQKRVAFLDYNVGMNELFMEKIASNSDWMLISQAVAPDLIEAMYGKDQVLYRDLYDKYDRDILVKKSYLKARYMGQEIYTQRNETGRQYYHYTDEMNRHTPFREPIYSSNLCVEIFLPTKGYKDFNDLLSEDSHGETALCFISAINATSVVEKTVDQLEALYYTVVKFVDTLIDKQDYPYKSIENKVKKRRPIGIGLVNLAYEMAKAGVKYSEIEGMNFVHRVMERHTYFLYKASLKLAKERGLPEWIDRTYYNEGRLPIDTYKKTVDELHTQDNLYDWATLKREIKDFGGIRNSTVSTIMPSESSSQATGATNSIYPIRELIVEKTSGDSKNVLIAPGADDPVIASNYELAWDVPDKMMISLYAITQKWLDQGISADFYKDFRKGAGKASVKDGLQQMMWMSKYGMKSAYYLNSYSTSAKEMGEQDDAKGCAGGTCTL